MGTRWRDEWSDEDRNEYAQRFVRLAAEGHDIDGEARLVDAMADRGARILDAGCGTGRVGAALAARGHAVLAVDADEELVRVGREHYPGLELRCLDLLDLDLTLGRFDMIVCAGNVMVYVEPGTEARVLSAMATVLTPGGRAIFGFATDRAYTVEDFDRDADAIGWRLEHRFGTWQLEGFTPDSDWAVSVYRA